MADLYDLTQMTGSSQHKVHCNNVNKLKIKALSTGSKRQATLVNNNIPNAA